MKIIILTTIFLFSLGFGWVKYLEYNTKRFIEKLPHSKQVETGTSNTFDENNKSVSEDSFDERIRVEGPILQGSQYGHPIIIRPLADNKQKEGESINSKVEPTQNELEELLELDRDEIISLLEEVIEDSSESSADSQNSETEENEEKKRARAFLQSIQDSPPDMMIPIAELIRQNPNLARLIRGKSVRPARVYLHYSQDETDKVREAIRTLND